MQMEAVPHVQASIMCTMQRQIAAKVSVHLPTARTAYPPLQHAHSAILDTA